MELKGKWERQTGQYQSGEDFKLGTVTVGAAFYSGTRGRDDPKKFAVRIYLPGIKQPEDHYETIERAKLRLERMVETWFGWVQS